MTTADEMKANGKGERSVLDEAQRWIERGGHPIPLYRPDDEHKGKEPYDTDWQTLVITPDTVAKRFSDSRNIGLVLNHGGFVDFDLDSPQARLLAPLLLPYTDCVYGRASAPQSHHVFRCPDIPQGEAVRKAEDLEAAEGPQSR